MQEVDGDTAKCKWLQGMEDQNQYPPHLLLRIIRPHDVHQDLETEVSMKGVVTKVDAPLKFTVFGQASPGK